MARRKNTRRFDPRYFMDEKIELTENQKQSIKTLLEQEIANGNQINEGVLQDLAKKFGVPIALVAAIASGIGAVNTSADVSPATNPDTTEMPADAGFDDSSYDAETGKWNVSNTMDVDTKTKKPFGPFKHSYTMDVDTKVKHKSDDAKPKKVKMVNPLGDLKKEGFTSDDRSGALSTARAMGRDDAPTSTSSGARVPEKYQALADKLIQQGSDARKVEQAINACSEESLQGESGAFAKCMYRKDTSSIYAMQDLGMIPQQVGRE